MATKRFLIILPLALIGLLLQSFFWVPTYDNQAKGNPERLIKFIETSSGDARMLNPVLHADSASGNIVSKVFDGLLDQDDQLNLRARLAESWTQYEEAYLTLAPDMIAGENLPASPEAWFSYIQNQMNVDSKWKANIQSIEVVPGRDFKGSVQVPVRDDKNQVVKENGRPEMMAVEYTFRHPPRLKFKLKKVDQYFFEPLLEVLGKDYVSRFPYQQFITAKIPAQRELLENHYSEILQVTEHNPVLIFQLRKGVRFHDSHEFDSGDVLFTYQAIMDPRNASPRTSDFEPVKSAEVMGKYQIKFVYKRLFSPAINAWMMGMLPEHLLNAEALKKEARDKNLSDMQMESFNLRDSDFNRNPVGTGPFVFKEWKSDQFIRMIRNEDYWEGPPEYQEFVMRIVTEPLTQEMEFYSGAADNYGVLPHQVARLKTDPKYQSFSTVGFSYSYIGYNLRKPLFQSPEVRRALGMAVDIDKIIKYVLYNEGERVTGPYPKMTDWYDPDIPPVPYDPEGALRLLNKLGWKKNEEGWLEKDGKLFEFNLITNAGNPLRKSILSIVQNSWRKIGIKCNTQVFEWAVFLKDFVNSLKFDALVLGWSMGTDPDLYQLWHSSQAGPNQLNFVGYENPEADRLIVAIRQEYDKAKQIEMTRELHRLIARDQPYTFLYVGKSTRLLDKKIVIVERQPDGKEKYQKIYPTKGGNIDYYFTKWRKLNFVPQFSPD
ncbi:MAG: ABC transporter substrate-binding protein [Nitrospinota bacterium]|nr:ABC transporter substrate-binding protein [Nitrospinota bacterium]